MMTLLSRQPGLYIQTAVFTLEEEHAIKIQTKNDGIGKKFPSFNFP